MLYREAKALHDKARNKERGKPIARNTRVVKTAKGYGIKLHNTVVVDIMPNNSFYVYSGNWHTMTTNDRICAFAPVKYFSGFHMLFGHWYGHGSYFYEGMKFNSQGKLISKPLLPAANAEQHIKEMRAALRAAGHVPMRHTYNKHMQPYVGCKYCVNPTAERCAGAELRERDRNRRRKRARVSREFWKQAFAMPQVVLVSQWDRNVMQLSQLGFAQLVREKSKHRIKREYRILSPAEYVAKKMLGELE